MHGGLYASWTLPQAIRNAHAMSSQPLLLRMLPWLQAEVSCVKAEAAAEVTAAGARAAELSAQLESSSEFLQQREALEGQLAALRAALAAKTKEVEQRLRWGSWKGLVL
jgi:hypothetical protein